MVAQSLNIQFENRITKAKLLTELFHGLEKKGDNELCSVIYNPNYGVFGKHTQDGSADFRDLTKKSKRKKMNSSNHKEQRKKPKKPNNGKKKDGYTEKTVCKARMPVKVGGRVKHRFGADWFSGTVLKVFPRSRRISVKFDD